MPTTWRSSFSVATVQGNTWLCRFGSPWIHASLGTAKLPGWWDWVVNATAIDSSSGYGIPPPETTSHGRGFPASVLNGSGAQTTVPRSAIGDHDPPPFPSVSDSMGSTAVSIQAATSSSENPPSIPSAVAAP